MANEHSAFKLLPQAMARAYLGSAQLNLVNLAWTKVVLDTESYDPGNNFDEGNYEFTAPIAGYYDVKGMVLFTNPVVAKRYGLAIYKNGGIVTYIYVHSSLVDQLTAFVFDNLLLAKNDVISMYAQSASGDNTVDLSPGYQNSFLAVHLLSAS